MAEEPIYPQNELTRMQDEISRMNQLGRASRHEPQGGPPPEPFPDSPPAEPPMTKEEYDRAFPPETRVSGRMLMEEARRGPLSIARVVLYENGPTGTIVMTDDTRYTLPDAHRQEVVAACLRGMQVAVNEKMLEIATLHGIEVRQAPPEASQNGQEAPQAVSTAPEPKRKGRPPKSRPGV